MLALRGGGRVFLIAAAVGVAACNRAPEITRPSPALMSATAASDTSQPPPAIFEWRCVTASPPPADCSRPIEGPRSSAVAANPPSAPVNLAVAIVSARVTLTWQMPPASDPATSFVVEAGSSSGRIDQANFDTGSTATTFAVDGVPAGTYYVRVRAKNAAGTSGPSAEIVVTVSGPCLSPPDARPT